MSSALPVLPSRELVLDRYRPLRPLGTGASGSVWLARDEQTGLDVALKIVPREGKAAHRAEREAEAAARLRHERCLRSYGFGADPGHVYIAYEYVGGRTLREAMRAGELTDARAVEAAAQILDGLAHAHGLGIVHRDVKPSNVLLLDEEKVSIRLLDFGLARFDEAETLTAVGDVPGTLAYISPERLRGEEARPASDVWGVGILLWESLSGKHPFWGTPLQQMAAAIETGAPPLQLERPDLPKRLLAAIERALAPDPARRPSASALAHELREAAAGRRSKPRARRLRVGAPQRPVSTSALSTKALSTSTAARALPAAAAGLATLVGGSILPFFPTGWTLALALAAALAAATRPRLGLAIALAAPVFPLGNLSLGLALLYTATAAAWLALSWREARTGLAFLAGPLLAPLGLLALVPLALQPVRGSSPSRSPRDRGRRRRRDRRRDARHEPPFRHDGLDARPRRCREPRRGGAHPPRRAASGGGARGAGAGGNRGGDPVCDEPLADRRARRRSARDDAPPRADRAGASPDRGRVAHVRCARLASRAPESIRLDSTPGEAPRPA